MDIKLEWEPRPEQLEIKEAFQISLDHGVPYLLVDAPTGVGKSYAAMIISDMWNKKTGGKTDIITNSKMLQSQYLRDFKFLAELKGKANYPCSKFGTDCDSGSELGKQAGEKCDDCPHALAFDAFIRSKVSMLNFHLFASYAAFVPHILDRREASMLIVDEAHSFEEVFTDFVSLVISERVLKGVGLHDNPVIVQELEKVKNKSSLKTFFNNFFHQRVMKHIKETSEKVHKTESAKVQTALLRNIKQAQRLLLRFKSFLEDEDQDKWIFQREEPYGKKLIPHIKIEPTWAREYLWRMVWQRYNKVVFLSATILDADIFTFLNGLNEEVIFCTVNSPFPVDNRRVYYYPVGKMSYKYKDTTIRKMIPAIEKILKKNPDQKGIIHTGNYENCRRLEKALKCRYPRLIFHGAGEAEQALKFHEQSEDPTVLVSPAMTHGVDLKDELSRLQVIMKVPFPSLGDERIKQRMYQNSAWYAWRTWIEVIQATGRSVRSEDDWAVTYILDSSFDQLMKTKKMMPEYFKEALVMPSKNGRS